MIRRFSAKLQSIYEKYFKRGPRSKFVYAWFYKHGRVVSNRILFESFHGKELSDSPYYILKALADSGRAEKYDIYFSVTKDQSDTEVVENLGLSVKFVDVTSLRYTRILATAKYLINNSSFPVYFIRKKEQMYLQTWHGIPLKTLGKSMSNGMESMYSIQHNFMQASHILFPNDFTRDVIMNDYNLQRLFTGKVVMGGYPRNSIFFDRERGKTVKKRLSDENVYTFAYMPTWRGISSLQVDDTAYFREVEQIIDRIEGFLNDSQKVYVNLHPIVQKKISLNSYKHIEFFPDGIDKYEFLNSVDCLITDYSSVFFDYSITGKPICLFMYDYERYIADRGLYFDINDLPFTKIYDIESLGEYIKNKRYRSDSYAEAFPSYRDRFLTYESDRAAEAMAGFVFEGKEEGLDIIDYGYNRLSSRRVVFNRKLFSDQEVTLLMNQIDREKDIVCFHLKQFNQSRSRFFYDHFRNGVDFMFISYTLPRTYLEEFTRRFFSGVQKKLSLREAARLFSDLPLEGNTNFHSLFYNTKGE